MPRTLLTLLPVSPFDPAGGAQRSMDGIARALARPPSSTPVATTAPASSPVSPWRCVTLATTALDVSAGSSQASAHEAILASRGIRPVIQPATPDSPAVLRFHDAGIDYILLDVPPAARTTWSERFNAPFTRLLESILGDLRPDVVHTFGASPTEMSRQALCRKSGCKVVLSVRNHGYYDRRAFAHADAVVMPSQWMCDEYRRRIGIEATMLPMPMDWDQTLAPERDPIFVTYVNPSPEKGVLFFARLAHELASRRPDIPMLVFESRAAAGTLVAAGRSASLDLTRHESVMVSPGVPFARDVFRHARILLVPSAWPEPSGRVIVEAMINSVPMIVSERGGMPEIAASAGTVLPLPAWYDEKSLRMPGPDDVRPWLDRIERLCDDEAFYAGESARARVGAEAWRPEHLAAQYHTSFGALVNASTP